THAAVRYAFKQCKTNSCFLKLDIRKYFDSINHEVLKTQLQRLIKDKRVIALLDGIIDSYETEPGKGVPIGNLTSQFFPNMYLAGLDHYIIEKLRPAAYCRYMDDFVLWASSQSELKKMFVYINDYVTQKLKLSVKPPVFGKSAVGLPFLGFLIKGNGIYLLQKSKKRFIRGMSEITALLCRGDITESQAAERTLSVFAAISLARTNRLKNLICAKGERFLALSV
ncbi:MAG: RNA-directed DNA polymerase, partial [Leptospirales bacterium]|nr:RNA-directed DNA polymerase [Leptospirales bacterium]